ncbi:MAG TPA: mechanosensitive ion channel [Nocardioidaceae bacterium]|nr:mechanosensitive ion channel [Nocardioidaceae bacterium]
MDIGESFGRAVDGFFEFLPNLLGFLVLLLIGYLVAKLVSKAVQKGLESAGVDRKLEESDGSKYVDMVMSGARPSRGIALVVFWLIFAFFLFSAIGALGIPALTTFMNQVLAYLPNIIAAIIIFVVAAVIAGAIAAGVSRMMGDTPTGKIIAAVLPALVMVIAVFMILEQLKIAEEIVRIAFAATMFALALGLALAFGLGGRPVAQRMLEDAYRKGQEEKDQVKRDMQTGRDRAEAEASQVGSQPESSTSTSGTTQAWDMPGDNPPPPRY